MLLMMPLLMLLDEPLLLPLCLLVCHVADVLLLVLMLDVVAVAVP